MGCSYGIVILVCYLSTKKVDIFKMQIKHVAWKNLTQNGHIRWELDPELEKGLEKGMK